ncbi:MAG: VCBS repeat-containing protein, partial [Bacteroidota bacterium]
MTKYYLSIILCLSFSTEIFSQIYTIEDEVPVEIDGRFLTNPWAGGLNSGQYNTMDLNNDGQQDIVVFDRTSSKVNTFLNVDGAPVYAPEYANQFPEGIDSWLLLRDFNCDGLKDIFTSDPLGIRVFVNESDEEGLKWRVFNSREPQSSALLTKGFTSNINLQMNSSDIPAIDDVDGDGDLDILVFRFSGNATIEFHKNFSIERTSVCDSIQLERVTQNWGDFEECECGIFAFNGTSCPTSTGGRQNHQSGKALLTIDIDNDGDKEIIFTEEECNNTHLLINEGTADSPSFQSATTSFPSVSNPARFFVFPAAYHEDVNFDGVKDLIVAPNIGNNVFSAVDFRSSSWFYDNTGTDQNPVFNFVQRNFLQDDMIELGENAAPAFGDYDGDGDLDMILGSFINYDLNFFGSSLQLFENVGTSSAPTFRLVDNDYLTSSNVGAYNIKPQFKDINSDRNLDLIFSATSLNTFVTSIFYVLNNASGAFSFNGNALLLFSGLGFNENFVVEDIDNDGIQDLLIGRSNGSLEYLRNSGTLQNPNFQTLDESFYGLGLSSFRVNTSVEIGDVDADGTLDMVTGDRRGNLTIYYDFKSNLDNPLEGVDQLIQFGDEPPINFEFGSNLKPRLVNLFGQDRPSIVLGTGQGGLSILRNTEAQGSVGNISFRLFPNPVTREEIVNIISDTN